jgi:hypothetical protein
LITADGVGGPRTMLRRGHCLKRQLRKVIPGHWSGWAHLRKAGEAGRRIQALAKAHYEQAAALGNGDAKTALMRAECSYVIKDKRGNFVANLCF